MWGLDNSDEEYNTQMLKDSIMDMWLLSKCEFLLFQGSSSFLEYLDYYMLINQIVMIGRYKNKLYLFTSSFPYNNGEVFLETEIKILSKRFSKVYIFQTKRDIKRGKFIRNIK